MRSYRTALLPIQACRRRHRGWLPLLPGTLALLLSGCLAPGQAVTPADRAVADAAAPLLQLDPDAVWTEHYNRLVELGPRSIAWLMRQPALTHPAGPDRLDTLLHASLVRLLANPNCAPDLSASAYEMTFDVLHFDPKVNGRRIGTVVLTERHPPASWLALYPADFDHDLAARVDLEADRQALQNWWQAHRDQSTSVMRTRPLQPRATHLWRLLGRRPADRWRYQPDPRPLRCSSPPRAPTLLDLPVYDYNLVRAVCVWLGTRGEPDIQGRLIELVAHAVPNVAHNARFALRYAPDPRIRQVLERFAGVWRPPAVVRVLTGDLGAASDCVYRTFGAICVRSCGRRTCPLKDRMIFSE